MEKALQEKIINHALSQPDMEVCGFLVFCQYNGPRIVPLENIHQDPSNFFKIDPKEFLRFYKTTQILATYHSHTDVSSQPSVYDKKMSKAIALPFYIYSLRDHDFYLHIPDTYQPKLEGRVYVEDILNCAVFVKNYYEQKFNVKWNWNDSFFEIEDKFLVNDKIITAIKSSGFKEVKRSDIKKHDLILFKGYPVHGYFHLAVYLGDGNFCHHAENTLSRTETFDDRHMRLVYKVYRYKENG